MQKTLRNIFLLSILLFICNVGEIRALDTSAVCVYKAGNSEVHVKLNSNYELELEEISGNSTGTGRSRSSVGKHEFYLSYYNFLTTDNKLSCLQNIYRTRTINNSFPYYSYYATISSGDSEKFSLVSSKSATYTRDDFNDKYTHKCNYGDVFMYFNNTEIKIQTKYSYTVNTNLNKDEDNITANSNFTVQDLNNACPAQLYVTDQTRSNIWNFYLNNNNGGLTQLNLLGSITSASELGTSTDPIDISGNDNIENAKKCAILGEELGDMIKAAIDLIQLAIPIIIVILTIIDFTGIVLSGEDKNFKAAGSKFVKRLLIGATIIFLPMLLTFIIDMSGVLVPYGIERNDLFCSLF